jgi:hypothetical protein
LRAIPKTFLVKTALALGMMAVVLVPSLPAGACNVQSGSYSVKYTGAYQDVSGIQGGMAVLDAYNPTPVFSSSSFWVMIGIPGYYGYYAQVGWVKWSGDSYEHVFLQYKDDSDTVWTYYYKSATDTWVTTPQTVPTGSAYGTIYDLSGSFRITFGGGAAYTFSATWVPNRLAVYGETHNYGTNPNPPPNYGDHVPGDTSNKIQAQVVQYYKNSSWTSASLTYAAQGNGAYTSTASPGFYIWDTRCSD